MRSVLITGASSGIGYTTALYLDRNDFEVFATVRSEAAAARLRDAASGRLQTLILDVTNDAAIRRVTRHVSEAVGEAGLYGLINNAGIAVPGPLELLPLDDLRQQFEVNVTGQVAMTQASLPLLRRARGRIINVGSVGGISVVPFGGAYCASKFALEAITDALRMELAPWGIDVVIIQPAGIATPIWDKALDTPVTTEAEHLYGPSIARAKQVLGGISKHGAPTDAVAEAIHHALTASRPKTRYLVGRIAYLRAFLRYLPDRWRDRVILSRFAGE